jgi:thiosulfate dehydrogenase (quinone) large subunit
VLPVTSRSLDQSVLISNPPIVDKLFTSQIWAILWLVVRVYVGYQWVSSGLGKIVNPAWMASGEVLKGFFVRAVAIPDAPARPLITYDWYRTFLQGMLDSGAYVWFAKVIVIGEILVGIALIIGLFTAIAAFFGGFMNWNFMMAGTASTNPVLLILSILLILAWRNAGHWGLDRFALPLLGTPWQLGKFFKRKSSQ